MGTVSASGRNPNPSQPVIRGANVAYQYLPTPQSGRRQRRQADTTSSEFMMREY